VPGSVSDRAWADVAALVHEIGEHMADRRGERLREGAEVVVLGAPNAGKSSLVNAIARRDVAIVTAEPGTTRDLIEVRLDLDGFPATLVDTAGLREAEGAVEREGVRRAGARAEAADVVLWLRDLTGPEDQPPPLARSAIRVGTKVDLIDSAGERSRFAADFDVLTSAATGEGVNDLLTMIGAKLGAEFSAGESPLITRARHRAALAGAVAAMQAALADETRPLELRAEDLRRAGDSIGRITGRIDVEELLDVIFRDFCIGK
jgi:tRNA modification GTPase